MNWIRWLMAFLFNRPITHLTPTAAALNARRKVGVSVLNDTYGPTVLSLLASLGVTRVRVTLYWQLWDVAYAATWNAMINGLKAAGLDVLVVVHTPPVGMTLAQGIAQMPAFVAARAAEHPGLAWQILSEMDTFDALNGGWFEAANGAVSETTRGTRYGQVLGPVYDAVKAADATATVVTGGTFIDSTDFTLAFMAQAPGKYDAIAAHAYGDPLYQPPGSLPHQGQFVVYAQRLRAIVGATPIWVTETGYSSATDSAQASQIGQALADNDANNRWDRTYLYVLVQDGNDYRLCGSDGTRRHAAMLLVDRTAA